MGVEGPLISAIVIPTHDSAVAETYKILRRLRNGLVPLVDGDLDGNMKVEELRTVAEPPNLVLQWRDAWAIEDTIGWVLKASAGDALADLQDRIGQEFDDIDALVALFKQNKGPKRLLDETQFGFVGADPAFLERPRPARAGPTMRFVLLFIERGARAG